MGLSPEQERREAAIRQVYRDFDIDEDGAVGAEEMLALGKAKAKLEGQGSWTENDSALMMRDIQDEKGYVNKVICSNTINL